MKEKRKTGTQNKAIRKSYKDETFVIWDVIVGEREILSMAIRDGVAININEHRDMETFYKEHKESIETLILHYENVFGERDPGAILYTRTSPGGDKKMISIPLSPKDLNTTGQWFFTSTSEDCHNEVVDMLLKAGADINAKYNEGYTALMRAALQGNNERVAMLLSAGADVNAKDQNGNTALILAEGHKKIIEMLVNAGAKSRGKLCQRHNNR